MDIGYTSDTDTKQYLNDNFGFDVQYSEDLQQPLRQALILMESLPWSGDKSDDSQTLQFPRNGETTIPNEIIIAQQSIAGLVFTNQLNILSIDTTQQIQREKVDTLEVTYFESQSASNIFDSLPFFIRNLLDPFLNELSTTGNVFTSAWRW